MDLTLLNQVNQLVSLVSKSTVGRELIMTALRGHSPFCSLVVYTQFHSQLSLSRGEYQEQGFFVH